MGYFSLVGPLSTVCLDFLRIWVLVCLDFLCLWVLIGGYTLIHVWRATGWKVTCYNFASRPFLCIVASAYTLLVWPVVLHEGIYRYSILEIRSRDAIEAKRSELAGDLQCLAGLLEKGVYVNPQRAAETIHEALLELRCPRV